jgi:hypothetical protein
MGCGNAFTYLPFYRWISGQNVFLIGNGRLTGMPFSEAMVFRLCLRFNIFWFVENRFRVLIDFDATKCEISDFQKSFRSNNLNTFYLVWKMNNPNRDIIFWYWMVDCVLRKGIAQKCLKMRRNTERMSIPIPLSYRSLSSIFPVQFTLVKRSDIPKIHVIALILRSKCSEPWD